MPVSGKSTDKKYTGYVVYQEGIYLGYRYTETRYFDYVTGREKTGDFDYSEVVSHPFGYGGSSIPITPLRRMRTATIPFRLR